MKLNLPDKLYYSIGEVAKAFDVNTSLIRYWEQEFPIIKPKKNKKGNRYFTPEDIKNLKIIYHLVKEKGYTLDGARITVSEDDPVYDERPYFIFDGDGNVADIGVFEVDTQNPGT